jgi:hypothetical protein
MSDARINAWLDQEDAMVAQMIRKHGVFIQYVGGDRDDVPPSFAYTVGLFGLGHPELVVTSVDPGTASGLLNHLADQVRRGDNLVPGQLLTFDDWSHRIVIEELPNAGAVLLAANRHHRRPPEASVEAFQLTYDDRGGRFPWDDGYANGPHIQPRPGRWCA